MQIHLRRRILAAVCLLLALAAGSSAIGQAYTNETEAQRDARMGWWRDARFGMFIHWGVYSVPAGEYKGQRIDRIGEWIMHELRIPEKEYREFAKGFNPVKYDPDAWAQLAKDAGMKYIVITSKHHDGFALFPSDATEWDIADASPYGKDLIGPLAKAAHDKGLKFGLYYSQAQDWNHPGGAKAKPKDDGRNAGKPAEWDAAQAGSFDDYLTQIAIPQTKEILDHYNPDVLWWDTPVEMNKARAERFLPILAAHPNLIVNNRLVRPEPKGDFDTPEQRIPGTGIKGDWETCMTMNKTWGYKSFDHDWKSVKTLLTNLIDIASKGGNYLLNIGPKPDGTIPQESIDRLHAIGKWMKVNGDAIYGTTASPVPRPEWGRITKKVKDGNTTLYLHVFDWPTDRRLPVGVGNEVVECSLLADSSRKFDVDRSDDGLTVNLTGSPPDEIASVVVLKIKGEPNPLVTATLQQSDGRVVLSAQDADIHSQQNTTPRLESSGDSAHIGFWTEPSAWLSYKFQLRKPGTYDVVLETAAAEDGSQFDVRAANTKLELKVPNTGNAKKYAEMSAGSVTLSSPGVYDLEIRPRKEGWQPVNLRTVKLVPAK